MAGITTVLVRPGVVEYVDLCSHKEHSRESFFGEADVKLMRVYGLIFKTAFTVKVLFEDDIEANEECEGIVIPNGCIKKIIYFKEDGVDLDFEDMDDDLPNAGSDVN
jgi:hypothetical protein